MNINQKQRVSDHRGIAISGVNLAIVFLVIAVMSVTAQKAADERLLEAEQRLTDLGYWVLNVDGVSDASTRHSITAFQKVQRLKRTGVLTTAVLDALRVAERPVPKFATGEAHVEIDITRQVLFFVDAGDVVTHVLPVSTGNEKKYIEQGRWQVAHTPRGDFKILRKINGVRNAPLGALYYPNYFYGGVAIHGSNSIPAQPASHGCVRIPRFADKAFSKMVSVGMAVFVYDNAVETQ